MKWLRTIVIVLAVAALAYVVWWVSCVQTGNDLYKTDAARVRSISKMVELCTTDIHEELPIKDSINGKWLVARQTVEGKIRFDIENLKMKIDGDTTVVYLPRERVDILENAGRDGYKVFDTWDGKSTLFPRTLTAAEENAVKQRWQRRARGRIYDRGYVRRARAQAVSTLTPLLEAMSGSGHIIVVDPTPEGTRPSE